MDMHTNIDIVVVGSQLGNDVDFGLK